MANIDYINMLQESLEKKLELLKLLQVKNNEQALILQNPNSTPEELDLNIDQKGNIVENILLLDNGFEALFKRVQSVLEEEKETYKKEIQNMKDLIRQITDLSVDVEVQERKNKELATAKFANIRSQIRETKKSQKAVTSYYDHVMKRAGGFDPQFLDSKK